MTPLQEIWRAVAVFADRGDLDAADLLPFRYDKPTVEMLDRISALLYRHHRHVVWFEDVCCRGIEAAEMVRRQLER